MFRNGFANSVEMLQNRLETLYEDKLDGRIDVAFFDRKARDWRAEQTRLLHSIEEHQKADRSYMDEGVRVNRQHDWVGSPAWIRTTINTRFVEYVTYRF